MRTVSFLVVVREPPLAMGTFQVESSHNGRAPAGRTEVKVKAEVLGVTRIDSKGHIAGLHMALTLAWQDPRVRFKTREPGVNEEFEYSPELIR